PDAGLPGGCDNTTTSSVSPWSTFYCIQVVSNNIGTTSVVFQDIQINFATKPPTPPTVPSIEPGDSHMKVFWQAGNTGEAIATYDVHVILPSQPIDTVNVRDDHRVTGQTN